MYHCASAAALLASASEHKSSTLVSSTLLSSQQQQLYTTIWVGPPSYHISSLSSPPLLCGTDNNWLMRFLFSGNPSMWHEVIYHLRSFIPIFKDLPMLGRMGPQHSRHNYSFNFSIRIFGSVNSISCVTSYLTLGYSYLVCVKRLSSH